MALPTQPVTLSPETIAELHKKLSEFRHSTNNSVALILAGAELIRKKPSSAGAVFDSIGTHPRKIADDVQVFSTYLEGVLGITHPGKSTPS